MSALKVENERLSNVFAAVQSHQRTIDRLLPIITDNLRFTHQTVNITIKTFRHLTTFIDTISGISSFQAAISTLLSGKLPYALISSIELTHALRQLQTHITTHRQNVHIMYRNNLYYYRHAKFSVTRHASF